MRLTHASSLNDPFECVPRNVGVSDLNQIETIIRSDSGTWRLAEMWRELETRGQATQKMRELFADPAQLAHFFAKVPSIDAVECQQTSDKNLRICCFTNPNKVKPLDEILLWSHYAAKHAGVRIEFDFDKEATGSRFASSLLEVNYDKHRVSIDHHEMIFGEGPVKNFDDIIIRTKSDVWNYEAEVRLVGSARELPSQDGTPEVGYVAFESSWVTGVDFGINCPKETIDKICKILANKYPKEVLRRRAYRHPTDFSIDYVSF